MRGATDDKKPHKMVRSSIACARCRRSKVKCVNNGPNSTCKSCAQSNRECTYPVAGSAPPLKRTDVLSSIGSVGESGESKKRNRKLEDATRRVSHRGREDVLDSPVLTRKVWDEIFELFKLHFATEMPFLHPPTFRNRMRQAAHPRDPNTMPADLEEGRVLLLGVLTLTARFHPGLVAHHAPNGSDPLTASEFYAAPLATAFGSTIRHLSRPSLENIQALLMLGLYDWGQTRGLSAWLNVGLAIRLAFAMGLANIDHPETIPPADARTPLPSMSPRDGAIEKEVRRRTLWSCFIMDRMLSAGQPRPTMIAVDKLAVQLPCSDDQFLFVHNVPTSFLSARWVPTGEPTPASPSAILSSDDGILSRYLRLVEIFGDLSEWCHAGGRRKETLPPWDPNTGFYQLRHRLEAFHNGLPPSLTFTEANLSAHLEKRNATTYASLHTLYALSLIVLHREYLPFVPLRCEKPVGPLGSAKFSSENSDVPSGFWEESAAIVMKSARDITEIVRTCQDSNALPESPGTCFAVWQAALICVYVLWFPQMDTKCYLTDPDSPSVPRAAPRRTGQLAIAEKLLGDMALTLTMVQGYLKCMEKMHRYYFTVYRDYIVRFKRGQDLEQYKHYERELQEFSENREFEQPPSDVEDQNLSRASTHELVSGVSEQMQGVETATRPNGSWAPINASSPPLDDERTKYTPHGQHPYGIPCLSAPVPAPASPVSGDSHRLTSGKIALASGTHLAQALPYSSITPHSIIASVGNACGRTEADDEAFAKWIETQDSISLNTGLDNFAQEAPMEQFARTTTMHGGSNFMHAIWSLSTTVEVEPSISCI
ncbi:unnamed protein product [Blumeria hordei]|uniref:Zn(2)-C6 fungal-type domain-containing protein n=1 Tax=Blumeria hordei TaxID=2867405 RepID=A0A383UUH8_BLUHO|nr:unnamed protein product [Blumeria hordei]